MISKLKERTKNKKGFTLVELIVVLVILAILIALLVPALTGYIDKANEKKVLAEAKLALNAAQTEESDSYSKLSTTDAGYKGAPYNVVSSAAEEKAKAIMKLAEVKDYTRFEYTTDDTGKVINMTYANKKYTAIYNNGAWETQTTTADSGTDQD